MDAAHLTDLEEIRRMTEAKAKAEAAQFQADPDPDAAAEDRQQKIYATVKQGIKTGLSIWPPRQDGSKAPFGDSWIERQHKPATLDELRKVYRDRNLTGIGVICGQVSGNLECLDFDERGIYDAFKDAAIKTGLKPLLDRIEAGYKESSPNGVHLLYGCEGISGNTKLATRPKRPEEIKDEKDKTKNLIETRGEGGFVIIAPTFGAVNRSGSYDLISGSLTTIPAITPEERRDLLSLARTFHIDPNEKIVSDGERIYKESSNAGGRPGDDFNGRATWTDVLYPHGWETVYERDGVIYLRRPGKNSGISATIGHNGADLFHCFTSSSPFEPDRSYTKFTAYAVLNHHGGFSAAAKELTKQGYGDTAKKNFESQENPLDAAVQRLAILPPLQYEQVRKAEAKALKVRAGTLDAVVKAARKGSDDDKLPFIEVDPWPELVEPAQLLSDIASTVRRFTVCNEEVSYSAALWIAFTWFIDVVQVAPFAVITSPEKRCGKTLLLSLIGRLSAKAITASNISPAALFRTIDKWQPTLMIDEVDSFLKDNEEMRGLLNSGHTRDSAFVIRAVGEDFVPTRFSTWGAKALAGIGHLADTLMDRSVILELRRKLPHEKVERIRDAEPGLFDELRSKLARFAEDYIDKVRQARPPLHHSLNDRAQDNWEPLLAIAMTAGNEWLQIGTTAALKLSGEGNISPTIGTELLSDIQKIFKEKQVNHISTAELLQALCADEEKPWAKYYRGMPITARQLATKLKAYGIRSKTIRIGIDTHKGYELDEFAEAFLRYVPTPPFPSVTPSQPNNNTDLNTFPSVTQGVDVTDRKQPNPPILKKCYVVTDKKGVERGEENNLRETSIEGEVINLTEGELLE